MNGWEVWASGAERHVMPQHDRLEHSSNEHCWCNPTYDDGVWVHHSADRREEDEQRRPS